MAGHDPKAWTEGFQAGVGGLERDTCPYPEVSHEAQSWVAGFIEGAASKREGEHA